MKRAFLREVLVGDVVVRASTWNPVRDAANDEISYIDLSAIDNVRKAVSGFQKLTGRDAPSRARQLVRAGDILVSTVRPNLNGVARVPDELDGATASTGFCVLRPRSEKIDSSFLFHWVRSPNFVDDMVRKATGASYPAVSDKIIFQSAIPFPPLDEQERIAAILDQADELRRKRQRAIARLNQLRQAIFYEMFGNAEQNCIPLSQYCDEIRMGPFGSLLHKSDYLEGGIPLINPTHIVGGEIAADLRFSIDQNKASQLEGYRLQAGDVVLGRRGEMGRCAVVRDAHDGYLCGTGSMFLRANRVKADPVFLAELIRSKSVVARIEAVASGVTMMNLNSKSFDRVLVPNISLSEQTEYFQRVRSIHQQKKLLEAAVWASEVLFASLRHRAFRGEL